MARHLAPKMMRAWWRQPICARAAVAGSWTRLHNVGTGCSLIVNTDTASDDAVALVLAHHNSHVDVRAINGVATNVPLDSALSDAIVTLDQSHRSNDLHPVAGVG
jgi:hypothetical protein